MGMGGAGERGIAAESSSKKQWDHENVPRDGRSRIERPYERSEQEMGAGGTFAVQHQSPDQKNCQRTNEGAMDAKIERGERNGKYRYGGQDHDNHHGHNGNRRKHGAPVKPESSRRMPSSATTFSRKTNSVNGRDQEKAVRYKGEKNDEDPDAALREHFK